MDTSEMTDADLESALKVLYEDLNRLECEKTAKLRQISMIQGDLAARSLERALEESQSDRLVEDRYAEEGE